MNIDKIMDKFDKKFPEYTGIGALFPIFKDTPNRNHVKSFLRTSLEEAYQAGRRRHPIDSDEDNIPLFP